MSLSKRKSQKLVVSQRLRDPAIHHDNLFPRDEKTYSGTNGCKMCFVTILLGTSSYSARSPQTIRMSDT